MLELALNLPMLLLLFMFVFIVNILHDFNDMSITFLGIKIAV